MANVTGATTQLVKKLEEQIIESDTSSFDVGEQRERNHRYVTLQPLGNEQQGRSHYVSPDVLDAVQSKKALFSETFLSNRQTVKFTSCGMQSADEAAAKTAYANGILRKNKYEAIFRDGWHNAFVAKRMAVMAYWHRDTERVELDITGATDLQVQQLIMQEGNVIDVDGSQVQAMPVMGGMNVYQGTLALIKDASHTRIKLLTPERYYRDPLTAYPEDAQWCAVEEDTTRNELVSDGYNAEQVEGLTVDYRFRSEEEDTSRKAHDQSWTRRKQYNRSSEQQPVTTYKTWTYCNLAEESYDYNLSFEPEDAVKLYRIDWAHGEVLMWEDGTHAIEEAEEMPFFEWTEMKIAHAEHGMCTADVMAHTQKVQSTLKRLIIDNQQMRNNSRYEAVVGALKNPRDLLDAKIGGVVWSRGIGSVAPLATPELSPLTMGVIQMLDHDGDKRDGYSALGKGTNTDAVRYQNADSMIERLTEAGRRRPMADARDFALTFLIPLCQYIVHLGMRNDMSQTQMEVNGKMIMVAPQMWQDDDLMMEAAVALTPQEGREHAQTLMMMHQTMANDPELATIYGVQQKHALMDSVFDALGVSDTTPYMQRPDSPEYAQKMQAQAQEAQMMQQKLEQIEQGKLMLEQSRESREWDKLNWQKTTDMDQANRDETKLDHDIRNDEQKLSLDWLEFRQQSNIEEQELQLERQQQRGVRVGN